MDRRTKGTVMTIVGIASLAALGAAIGAASYRHDGARRALRRGRRRMERMTDWDAVTALIERMADAVPRHETERVLQRIQAKLKNL